MWDMNSGYNGYSMSKRAAEAYENGERPLSRWTKADIICEIKRFVNDNDVSFSMSEVEKAPKSVLADLVLRYSSYHHTSSYINTTYFYCLDTESLDMLTDEKIKEAIKEYKSQSKEIPIANKYKGTIQYFEWSGTRKHPKAIEHILTDVNIEEKGCFYIITDDAGKVIIKKKIGSNGTVVSR